MYSMEDDTATISMFGSSLVVTGFLAGTIWTWHTTFFVIVSRSSFWLIGIKLPNFLASVLVRILVERRQSSVKSSGVRLVSISLAAGFCGDGFFRLRSESEERDMEVSDSNGMSCVFALLHFFVRLHLSVSFFA